MIAAIRSRNEIVLMVTFGKTAARPTITCCAALLCALVTIASPASFAQTQPETPATSQSPAPPAPVAATEPTAPIAIDPEPVLPHDLSPVGMFLAADLIVKAVMIGLAFASVVTWSVWLAKALEMFGARRKVVRDIRALRETDSLREAAERFRGVKGDVAELVGAAINELRRSQNAMNHEGIKERVASLFSRVEAGAAQRMTRGTSILATIGSTGPFVGLFGTVWGIMNSFIGISKSQTTNLAVVAPGIAEALLATALGLVAAIPAVVIYNMFARSITGYRGLLSDASAELMRMVSRDLDRLDYAPHRRAAE
jgi:biopolymer transport protein ExbB